MLRRNFLLRFLGLGGALVLSGEVSNSSAQTCGGASCISDLICQWNNTFDDDREIDDSDPDEFPTWGGDPGINPDELKSPLAALGFYLKFRLEGDDGDLKQAYQILGYGQFTKLIKVDDDNAENYFKKCINGDEEGFWYCLTGLTDSDGDLARANGDIDWQFDNNHLSLQRYALLWNGQRNNPNHLSQMYAMYFLCLGQRHSPGVVKNYRACFRQKPDDLFKLVAARLGIKISA
jgi:hypothetical protein